MAPITVSVEIARPPEEVFAYVTDPSHLSEWQESVVRVQREGSGPASEGTRVGLTRRVGRIREIDMTAEVTEVRPPTSWVVRGVDGPVRGVVRGTVDPLQDGRASRVTLVLDFEGHGFGKLLVPLVVRRQASSEMPKNVQKLKQLLEGRAAEA
jgi:uncharacterized protein YndB with AHSA1/START domain